MLTRENIKNGFVQDLVAKSGVHDALPLEEIIASSRRTLAEAPAGRDIWVFAYGSLIWNPAFHFEEKRKAHLFGYHRKFCLWTFAGRGNDETPGLTLALDHGGACRGIAYRVAREKAEEELEIIWRREMVTGAYQPRWVQMEAEGERVSAISFVVNRRHSRYASSIPEGEMIAAIARARGELGPCAEYLHNTVDHLRELGIVDRPLFALREKVEDYCRCRGL